MTYDRGSAVIVEVTFQQQDPFGAAPVYYDPATAKITITDPNGMDKVVDAALTKSAIGKYYYICQTQAAWPTGVYTGKATSSNGTYGDVTINTNAFGLR